MKKRTIHLKSTLLNSRQVRLSHGYINPHLQTALSATKEVRAGSVRLTHNTGKGITEARTSPAGLTTIALRDPKAPRPPVARNTTVLTVRDAAACRADIRTAVQKLKAM